MADESNSTISVTLRAVISELIGPMKQAGEAVQASTQQMSSSFDKLGHTFEGLMKGFGAITAILAGGAMFKHAVDDAIKWNMEAGRVSKTLGITTQEASYLKVALHTLGIETDVYLQANRMMIRGINGGGEGFKKLRIDLRDVNGNLKPSTELMTAALEKIDGMTEGISQQGAAMEIFKRAWGPDMQKLLRMTKERMEEAKKEAEELHLVVGPEGVAQTREYQESMRKLSLIQESLQIQVGNQLLPVLKDLGVWLGHTGPAMAEGLAVAIKSLATAFFVLKAYIEVVVIVVTTLLMTLWNIVSSIASAIVKVIEGDYKGAWNTLKQGGQDMMNWIEAGADQMGKSIGDAISDSAKMWEKHEPKATKKKVGEDYDGSAGAGGDDAWLKKWEANLRAWEAGQAKKAAMAGKFHEKDLAAELSYWTEISKFPDLSAKEQTAVRMKMSSLEIEIAKKELTEKKAALDTDISNERVNLQRKLELAKQELNMHETGTRDWEKSRKRVLEVEREIQDELNALKRQSAAFGRDLALKGVEEEQANLAYRKEMGQLSIDEELEAQRSYEARRLAIAQASIDDELTQKNLTQEKVAELNNKRFMLEVDYHAKLKALGHKAALDQKNAVMEALSPLNAGIQSSLQGLLSGTMRWSDAFKNIWKSLGATVDKFLTDMAMNYLKKKQGEVAVEWWASTQKVAASAWAAIKSVAVSAWQAMITIGHRAWEAMAGAYASISEIPMVGPFLAPAVAAGVLAAVIGLGSHIASAAGGWHTVPNDQLAMIHKDEQVLPAKYAEGLRSLIENGGAQGGGGFSPSFTIHAMDAKGVERVLRDNNSAVGKAMRDYGRNFGGMK